MPETSRRSVIPGLRADDVWAWHARPGALERLTPPWQEIRVEHDGGPLTPGKVVVVHVRGFGRTWTWTSTVTRAEPPHAFDDVTEGAPLARWRHAHRFVDEPGGVAVQDVIDWALKGPARLASGAFATDTARLLAHRHRLLAEELPAHARHAGQPRRTVGITGASGLVGTALTHLLTSGGHRVVPLVRRAPRPGEIRWDPARGVLDPADLRGLDAVVNLAGESIAGAAWSDERKARIRGSRVDGTALLARAMAEVPGPRVLVSASAVGFWGDAPTPVDEDSPAGTGFLADVAQAWEAAADPARQAGIRVVHPRLGVVISGRGGMLPTLARLVRTGLGGPAGSGRQGLPWVALDDVIGVIHEALLDDRYDGPIATVAPADDTNADVTHALGRVLGRPTVARAPAAAVRLVLGEQGDEVVLAGQRVRPARLRALGYRWRRPELEDTLRWELGRFEP
jgi:uncharacterized protein (TIGR01777 family)